MVITGEETEAGLKRIVIKALNLKAEKDLADEWDNITSTLERPVQKAKKAESSGERVE
jgi:hypothetical protein